MRNKQRIMLGYLFLIPALILFLVFVAYPVYNTIRTSFYALRIQTLNKGGRFIGWDNYVKLAKDATMWRSLQFTVLFTVIAVCLETWA